MPGRFVRPAARPWRLRSVEPDNTLAYTALSMFYNAKGMIAKAEEMGAKAGAASPPEDSS